MPSIVQRFKPLVSRLQALHHNSLLNWLQNSNSQPLEVSSKSAIVIAPHQDDETIGCGGLIALKRRSKIPVKVVFLTNGGSSPVPPGLTWEEMISLRRREATIALDQLGVAASEIHFLDYPDSQLSHLSHIDRRSLVENIAQICDRAEEIYVPHCKDAHPDHEAAYQLTLSAIELLDQPVDLYQYPVWMFWRRPLFWKLNRSDLEGFYRLDIQSVQAQKKSAIDRYQSQVPDMPQGFITPYLGTSELFCKRSTP
ncbi:MAG TPA: PIG-L family deacetylase [Leptolyngbya sp.]|jgi:LmbE family N-acetylglucosaminyl deacetylase|nr:PIG-L family deacetylase [Leptolyngbya sp.]